MGEREGEDVDEKQVINIVSKYLPTHYNLQKLLYTGQTKQYLNQGIKINIMNKGQTDMMCLQV